MSDYVPTTAEIRKGYIGEPPDHFMDPLVGAEFDRWLAEHDREVAEAAWDEGQEAGMSNYSDARNGDGRHQLANPHRVSACCRVAEEIERLQRESDM